MASRISAFQTGETMFRTSALALALVACLSGPLSAKGVKTGSTKPRTSSHTASSKEKKEKKTSGATKSSKVTVGRDAKGRIRRSAEAKDTFMRQTGYPHGRSGYVVDHIVPLACGGADVPGNMQWQTVTE